MIKAYQIDTNAYMVIGCDKKHPNNIALLQLTGATAKALPFKGLVLGDDETTVIAALGKPDEVTNIKVPKVSRLSYKDRNYSVEIDDHKRLYSIQIFTNADLVSNPDSQQTEWLAFREAVLSRDFGRVAEMLRPDVEIYKAGRTLSINEPYSKFIANPDEEFVSALLAESSSVLEEISQTEPETEFRLREGVGAGPVYKFRKGKILCEISFFPHNGKYRVYEISFKK